MSIKYADVVTLKVGGILPKKSSWTPKYFKTFAPRRGATSKGSTMKLLLFILFFYSLLLNPGTILYPYRVLSNQASNFNHPGQFQDRNGDRTTATCLRWSMRSMIQMIAYCFRLIYEVQFHLISEIQMKQTFLRLSVILPVIHYFKESKHTGKNARNC